MPFLPPSHPLCQVANAFLFLSYLTTNILYLRIFLAIAAFFFVLWGWLILDIAIDLVIWNGIFCVINLYYTVKLFLAMVPKKFDPVRESVYDHFFGDGKQRLSRGEFDILTSHTIRRELRAGDSFAEYNSYASHLTLLVSGSMTVYSRTECETRFTDELITGMVSSMSFIDSPEFMYRNTKRGSMFEVAIRCSEDCTLLQWPYDELNLIFKKHPNLRPPMDAILGLDLAAKIFGNQKVFLREENRRNLLLHPQNNNIMSDSSSLQTQREPAKTGTKESEHLIRLVELSQMPN